MLCFGLLYRPVTIGYVSTESSRSKTAPPGGKPVRSLTVLAVESSFAVFLLGTVLNAMCRESESAGPESADWPTQNHERPWTPRLLAHESNTSKWNAFRLPGFWQKGWSYCML